MGLLALFLIIAIFMPYLFFAAPLMLYLIPPVVLFVFGEHLLHAWRVHHPVHH